MQYKGKHIKPYESFYWNTTQEFFRGELGGGIARCVKCDDSLAILVMEEPQIIKEGNYHKSGHNASSIVNPKGITQNVMENHGTVTAIIEPRVMQVGNILDDTDRSFSNPQTGRVYSPQGLSPTINTCQGGGRQPKILEMNENGTSNTITSVQKDNLVVEPQRIGNIYPSQGQNGNVYNVNGVSPTILSGQGVTGNGIGSCNAPKVAEPQVINPLKGQTDNGWHYEQQVYADDGITRAMKAGGGSGNIPKVISELEPKYRIRKLTPRECFRLMGVDDDDIDTIQASGISNSSQYKLAGNSIVVDVLYHIFRKAFVEKENESQQLTFF